MAAMRPYSWINRMLSSAVRDSSFAIDIMPRPGRLRTQAARCLEMRIVVQSYAKWRPHYESVDGLPMNRSVP
jgi:hypothetical protein